MSTGVGAILVGIGTAVAFIANNAKGIGAGFSSFFKAVKEGLKGDRFAGFVKGLERISEAWKAVTGEIDSKKWEAWGDSAGTSVAKSIIEIADALDSVVKKWESFKSVWNQIQDVLQFDVGKAISDRLGTPDGSPKTRAADNERRKPWIGIPTIGVEDPVDVSAGGTGSMKVGGSGNGNDVWSKGAEGVKHLDGSPGAASAGDKTGSAYTSALGVQLAKAEADIRSFVQRATAVLNFSASPTITPSFGPVSLPGKSSSADRTSEHPAFADVGFRN